MVPVIVLIRHLSMFWKEKTAIISDENVLLSIHCDTSSCGSPFTTTTTSISLACMSEFVIDRASPVVAYLLANALGGTLQ